MCKRILAALDAWLTNLGPNRDAHNERIKLVAGSLIAAGLASLIAGFLGPFFNAARNGTILGGGAGLAIWAALLLASYRLLGYIREKD